MNRPALPAAFSLVEVVLALGIVSFALVALMGLFSVGLNTARESADDTQVANMAWRTVNQLTPANCPAPGTSSHVYFDHDGSTTNQAAAYYDCQMAARTPPATELAGVSTNLVLIQLVFTWPMSAAVRPYTNTVFASFRGD